MTNGDLDPKLDSLFQAYKGACPEVEGSVNFMPNLWAKIEARQTLPLTMGRFTKLFVSAAAALCLLMSLLLVSPVTSGPAFVLMSYIEALDNDQPQELMAYADLDGDGPGDNLW
jgi:hypothetical protein